MLKGIVADIQRASVHEGPGLRTTVFFKGCPLSCKWCHNPECISFEPETLFYPEKCINCGMCFQGCYSGARVICGKEMTAEDIFKEINLDRDYYGKDGGVTFSGGEPLAQAEFLNEMIDLCKKEGINTAIETSLIIYNEEIFKKLDLVMADLKIWDDEIHREYTGVSNKKIKENFIRLNKLGVPIIARTPVIPSVNQGIEEISSFLKKLENVIKYELLPYHPLGISKLKALRRDEITSFEVPGRELMEELNKYAYVR